MFKNWLLGKSSNNIVDRTSEKTSAGDTTSAASDSGIRTIG